jgi:phosphoadenosine phosphosulfate reductase
VAAETPGGVAEAPVFATETPGPPAALPDLEEAGAERVLTFVAERFHPRLYVACSFQKEASVIMDMLLRIEPRARFFTLDTDVLFDETYATWRAVEERYGIQIEVFRGMSLSRQAAQHGDELWARDPDACCGIRKVAPLAEALAGVDAWVSGLRREQSPSRAGTRKLHWDKRHGLWKANPLADWSDTDVWRYIAANGVPYNKLHDRGYASIGCTHCTQPSGDRAGRWAGQAKSECGLHG